MKFRKLITISILFISTGVNAALVERLGGLAYYDTEADLTWLADANAAGFLLNWNDASAWVASLDVAGVTGWRLPTTTQPDLSCTSQGIFPETSFEYNCTASEMGNMFYNVLGGVAAQSIDAVHNDNYLLFSNIQTNFEFYWSSTEWSYDANYAWVFNFTSGYQDMDIESSESGNKVLFANAWAVYEGDVSAVPVPAAVWLFGSGLLALTGFARRKRV